VGSWGSAHPGPQRDRERLGPAGRSRPRERRRDVLALVLVGAAFRYRLAWLEGRAGALSLVAGIFASFLVLVAAACGFPVAGWQPTASTLTALQTSSAVPLRFTRTSDRKLSRPRIDQTRACRKVRCPLGSDATLIDAVTNQRSAENSTPTASRSSHRTGPRPSMQSSQRRECGGGASAGSTSAQLTGWGLVLRRSGRGSERGAPAPRG